MCGLVGIVSLGQIDGERLRQASETLAHRGPDGDGYAVLRNGNVLSCIHNKQLPNELMDARVVVAHRRLAILDTSHKADQPMCEQGVALAYNGEIYNFVELRRELEASGYSFFSDGDTEVVLKAYLAWGPDCFSRFNGMWSLAIIDSARRKVVLSRDRIGIKPLYWALVDGQLAFASEITALRAARFVGSDYESSVAARYLCLGSSDVGDSTWFKDVKRFPAACWTEVSLDASTIVSPDFKSYWSPGETSSNVGDGNTVEAFRDLFNEAVARHLVADVPVGTCLSGGLDSTSILLSATGGGSKSYTHKAVGYVADSQDFSELDFMRMAAETGHSSLSEVRISAEEVISALPTILRAQGEPFGSPSVIAQWFVFERANRAGLKVMIDGQGADELLGGYQGYVLTRAREDLMRGRFFAYCSTKARWEAVFGRFPLDVKRIFAGAVLPRSVALGNWWKSERLSRVLSKRLRRDAEAAWLNSGENANDLSKSLVRDMTCNLLPALLRYEDRNAMSHSIESRVPFLDRDLVDFCVPLATDWKVKGLERKRILVQAMVGTVPEEILSRKTKVGFTAQSSWLETMITRFKPALIENRTAPEEEWFEEKGVEEMLGDKSFPITSMWRVVNTKLWCRMNADIELF